MSIRSQLFERAKKIPRKIVFPEGTDQRVIEAAYQLAEDEVVDPILIADEAVFEEMRQKLNLPVAPFEVLDPHADQERFAHAYYQCRRHKGISEAEALKISLDPLFKAALMVRLGKADGAVGGAVRTTADTVRSAIQCVGPKSRTVSSFFLMVFESEDRALLYADCGVLPFPNAQQLCEIALSSAQSWRMLMGTQPNVAMLSFSTYGSAQHESIDTILQATNLVRRIDPMLKVDGDLQVDAALVPSVAAKKAPGSVVAGKSNVLVFPNLHAGNIAYKLTQRLAGATALGPILQGLKKPINDLSRGCVTDDIVLVAGITAIQCADYDTVAL